MLQNGIVFLSDVTYELQSINRRLCQYRCDNDNENAFVLKRAPTINHTWTDGFGIYIYKLPILLRNRINIYFRPYVYYKCIRFSITAVAATEVKRKINKWDFSRF